MKSLTMKKRALNRLLRVRANEVKTRQMPKRYLEKKRWSHARDKVTSSYAGYRDKLRERARQLRLSPLNQRRFQALCGFRPMGGQLRHSDIPARRKFARLVAREIHRLYLNDPELKFMFLTLLADEGITSDRRPVCYVEQLRDKARRAMMALGVDGISAIEITPLMNFPQKGRGRSLLLHVHMLIWYNPKQHEPKPVHDLWPERGYCAWSCRFGADPIRVTVITPEMGTPGYWAAYMLKGAHEAKNRVPRTRTLGTVGDYKLMSTIEGYRPELAMRLQEFSSQVPLTAMSLGTKGGAIILRRCRKQLSRWAKSRTYLYPDATKKFDEAAFWERSHRFRRKKHRRFFILGPTID